MEVISFFFKRQPRNLSLGQNVIPPKAHDKNQLNLLTKCLEKFQICPGVSVENYLDQLPETNNTPVYKTTDGQPAAFVESVPKNCHQQIIRFTKRRIFVRSAACCTTCSQTNHYMRTLKSKSQSYSVYSELQESGFLKLPSGRTLFGYKNFCSTKSGWQISVLDAMQNYFVERKIAEVGKYGDLFYDKVKIKKGLLCDPSSWELIGFTDLKNTDDNGTDHIAITSTVQRNLAKHVLQFFSKSFFASFQFLCSYFLTRGISARDIRLFLVVVMEL